MSNSWLLLAFIVAQGGIVYVVLRLLPSAITKFVEKEIERRSDTKLEEAKAEIQGAYGTLKSSVDLLSATNSRLQPEVIDTVKTLWGLVVTMKGIFGPLVTCDQVFLPTEISEAFKHEAEHKSIIQFLEPYRDDANMQMQNGAVLEPDLDRYRLFCDDRLWLIFFAIRAIYMRTSMLVSVSFKEHEYRDWRKNNGVEQLLGAALKPEVVAQVTARDVGGLSFAIDQLETEFLHEATRVMSGSKAVAHSLSDVQAVMLLENAKIAASKGS